MTSSDASAILEHLKQEAQQHISSVPRKSKWDEVPISASGIGSSAASSSSNFDATRKRKTGWDEEPDPTRTQGSTLYTLAQRDPVERALWMNDNQIGRLLGRRGIANGIKARNNVRIKVGTKELGGAEVFLTGDRGDVDKAETTIRVWLTSQKCPLPEAGQEFDEAAFKEKAAKHAGKVPDFVSVRSRRKLRLDRRLKELVTNKRKEELWRAVSEGRLSDIDETVNIEGKDPQVMLKKIQSDGAVLWNKSYKEGLLLTTEEDVGTDAQWIWPARWNLADPTLIEIEEISAAFSESIAAMKEKNDSSRAAWFAANPVLKVQKEENRLARLGEAQLLRHMRDEGWAVTAEDTCSSGVGDSGGPVASQRRGPRRGKPVDGGQLPDEKHDDADVGSSTASGKIAVEGSQQLPSFDTGEEVWSADALVDAINGIGEDTPGDEWVWVAGADPPDRSDPERTQHKLVLPRAKAGWKPRKTNIRRQASSSLLKETSSFHQRSQIGERRRERSRSPKQSRQNQKSSGPIGERRRERSRSPKQLRNYRKTAGQMGERRGERGRSPKASRQVRHSRAFDKHEVLTSAPWRRG